VPGKIAGVHHVDNQLTVSPQPESPISDLNGERDLEDTTGQLHGLDQIREQLNESGPALPVFLRALS
jgi:hypothetical protein